MDMSWTPRKTRVFLCCAAVLALAAGSYGVQSIRGPAWQRFQLFISPAFFVAGTVPGLGLLALAIWAGLFVSFCAVAGAWGDFEREENRRAPSLTPTPPALSSPSTNKPAGEPHG
jgi:hypothetical protein